MNKIIIILLFGLALCDSDMDSMLFQSFQKFIKKYHKKYNSINEFLARFEVFKRNVVSAFQENESYTTGITKFSDLTYQEFAKIYLNLQYNLEALYCLYKKKVLPFSVQMLVDCDTYDSGCNGGLMEYSYTWLKENGGIMTDADYPYKGYKGTCQSDPSKYVDMTISGYKKLGSSTSTWSPVDEDEMKEFLYEVGPLAIALNANPLQTYTGGVLDKTSSQCPVSGINHAVLLVGYGHDDASNKDYWLVKNSWGQSWGEDGYFRIKRGSGTCGVNCYVITATVLF